MRQSKELGGQLDLSHRLQGREEDTLTWGRHRATHLNTDKFRFCAILGLVETQFGSASAGPGGRQFIRLPGSLKKELLSVHVEPGHGQLRFIRCLLIALRKRFMPAEAKRLHFLSSGAKRRPSSRHDTRGEERRWRWRWRWGGGLLIKGVLTSTWWESCSLLLSRAAPLIPVTANQG